MQRYGGTWTDQRRFSGLKESNFVVFTMILIVPLFIVSLFLLFSCKRDSGLRIAICKTILTTGLIIAFGTELASALNGVTQVGIFSIWLIASVIVGVLLFIRLRGNRNRKPVHGTIMSPAEALRAKLHSRLVGFQIALKNDRQTAILAALILLGTFITAIFSAPNNYDSMTYHMARVSHWIQQQNVDFHETNNGRQNMYAPFAEYVILHLQLLSGSDRFANLIQWGALLLSMVAGSLIAKQFGQNTRVQVLAALIIVTIPMAIFQASSTQNDLVAGSLCLCFAVFLFRSLNHKQAVDLVFCSSALGLALLAKSTSWLFCGGIGICLCFSYLFSVDRLNTKMKVAALMMLVVAGGLSINVFHGIRNYQAYGDPLSSEGMKNFCMNQSVTPAVVYANFVRNVAVHLGTGNSAVDSKTQAALVNHLGEHANHPGSTFGDNKFKMHRIVREDCAGNLWHVLLMPTLFAAFFCVRNKFRWEVAGYVAAIIVGFGLFCMALKWQMWTSRLQLPLFLLAAPTIAIAVYRLTNGRTAVLGALVLLLGVSAWEPALKNLSKRLASSSQSIFSEPRIEHYFGASPNLASEYQAALQVAQSQGSDSIGLCLGADAIEYPLWVLAGKSARNQSPQFVPLSDHGLRKAAASPEIVIVDDMSRPQLPTDRQIDVLFESDRLSVVRIASRFAAANQSLPAVETVRRPVEIR